MNIFRRQTINDYIQSNGKATYDELMKLIPDISCMTLRRDLEHLEKEGLVLRVRGGARSVSSISGESEDKYAVRAAANVTAKTDIAEKAMPYVQPEHAVYFDSGSTLMLLANKLENGYYSIITPAPNLAIELLKKNKIDIISINDREYPQILKEIYDPPISLYIKGNKDILNNPSIAIIGCREASDYGKKTARYFSYNLANKNINIISGLAKGVDSYAHIGTLSTVGRTIAVVGNGLDSVYPVENKELLYRILKKGGAIISEYPLGTRPEKMNFPARNRIISGMSKGVIVIEAKKKSGTLITVDFALEQGRDVYVIPGNINSVNSAGTNELIKQGAKLVTTYDEIEI